MTPALTLADLTTRAGLEVLSHLERQAAIPVTDRLQAQGDLIVIPWRLLGSFTAYRGSRPHEVPPEGVEVLRSAAGGNPHTLIADPGTCQWNTHVFDETGLGLGVLTATAPVYLIHPEHGGAGIAPGTYILRRQREYHGEYRGGSRLVAD